MLAGRKKEEEGEEGGFGGGGGGGEKVETEGVGGGRQLQILTRCREKTQSGAGLLAGDGCNTTSLNAQLCILIASEVIDSSACVETRSDC